MTTFVLSHNLQVNDSAVPALAFDALAAGLQKYCPSITAAETLSHPHWKVKLESTSSPEALARELVQGWRRVRKDLSHGQAHAVMALGGRKDSEGNPGAPLQEGGWGVDVVETADPQGFLAAINWSGLTAGRPADGVFQVVDPAS